MTSLADGSFAFDETSQPSDSKTDIVRASAPGFMPASEPFRPSRAEDMRIVLRRGGGVSVFVRSAETGQPVPDAVVTLTDDFGSVTADRTDEAGRAQLIGAVDRTLHVQVTAAGMQSKQQRVSLAPATRHVIVSLEPGLPLRVRVMAPDGQPVAGARVDVYDYANSARSRVVTDSSGVTDPFGVSWKGLRVRVHAPGYVAYSRVTTGPSASPELEVRLRTGGWLRVRVVAPDRPRNTWTIIAQPANERELLPAQEATEDATGSAVLEDLSPGSLYKVFAHASGLQPYVGRRTRLLAVGEVRAAAGGSEIEWEPPQYHPVQVRCLDENRLPFERVRVTFESLAPTGSALLDRRAPRGDPLAVVRTDEDGLATAWLPDGAYAALCSTPEGYRDEGESTLRVAGEGTHEVIVQRGVRISGTVTTARGQPMPHRRVFAHARGFGRQAFTDADGRFEIVGLKPQSYRVIADGFMGEPAASIAKVTAPARDLRLQIETMTLVGRVRDAGGKRLPVFLIRAIVPFVSATTMTDVDGNFSFEEVSAGKWMLMASDLARTARWMGDVKPETFVTLEFPE